MKLDYLFFGAHPDDVEMFCTGTILIEKARGKRVGIVDFTRGELGSRGSVAIRDAETKKANAAMGLDVRHNLNVRDGFFTHDEPTTLRVIEQIRRFQPDVVFANAQADRHPDHGRASKIVEEAFFLSGLKEIKTSYEGKPQVAHRPFHLFFYPQDRYTPPSFVVSIPTAIFQKKLEIIQCYASQFYSPEYSGKEVDTYLSTPDFFETLKSRFRHFGQLIGAPYGEGFVGVKTVGFANLSGLLRNPF